MCRAVTDKDLNANCVFDVATTGDETFVKGYLFAQELRDHGTVIQLTGAVGSNVRAVRMPGAAQPAKRARLDEWLVVTATVRSQTEGKPVPTGTVVFTVDGVPQRRPVELDASGTASIEVGPLKPGEHQIRATYSGGGKHEHHSSTSPNLIHVVAPERVRDSRPDARDTQPPGNRNRIPI
jgi:hypothetical protein